MIDYGNEYSKLHSRGRYGISSEQMVDTIWNHRPKDAKSVLDYSCGQSQLLDKFPIKIKYQYDPYVMGRDIKPEGKFDWIINTDVLEHIPEGNIPAYIDEMLQYGDKVFFAIAIALDTHKLSDGSPAHITVHPKDWWLNYLGKWFDTLTLVPEIDNRFRFAVKTY